MTGIGYELEARHWDGALDPVSSPVAPVAAAPVQAAAELQPTSVDPDQLTNGDPDPEALEIITKGLLGRMLSRRHLTQAGLLAGAAAMLDTTMAYHAEAKTEERLPPGPATFTWITKYKPGIHNEVMIFFPGTGDLDSLNSARLLRHQADLKYTPLAALTMSHEHTTRTELRELILDNIGDDPPQYVSSIGKSWGGLEGLIDTAYVANEIGAKLGRISMISAPSGYQDATCGEALAFFDRWTPDTTVVNYNFAAFIDFWRECQKYGFWPIISNIERTHRVLATSEDPNGDRSEIHMLCTANLQSHATFSMLQRAVQAGVTTGSYVSPKDPQTDTTVNEPQAYRTLQTIMKKLRVPFPWIPGDFSGHAKMAQSVNALSPWFDKTNPGVKALASK